MKELAEQASTGTYTTAQREIMNSEYQAMADEIDRIANATDFNGVKLLDGSLLDQHGGDGLKIHFGTGNDAAEDYYFMTIGDLRASSSDGLRVGGGESYWQSNNLDATSSSADLGATGAFGIEVSSDGGTTWELYGFTDVNSGDSLDDIVSEIDAGRAATGSLEFAAALNATNYDGASFTIGSQVFNFTASTTSASLNAASGVATSIGLDLGATTIMNTIAAMINSNAVSSGFYAAVDGATLDLAAYAGGTAGNSSALAHSSASLFTETAFAGGATGVLDASAYETDAGEFELRIESSGDYQFRVFTAHHHRRHGARRHRRRSDLALGFRRGDQRHRQRGAGRLQRVRCGRRPGPRSPLTGRARSSTPSRPPSWPWGPWTPPSKPRTPPVPPSAPCRTGWRTPSPTCPSRPRTCRRPSPASATWTWPPR